MKHLPSILHSMLFHLMLTMLCVGAVGKETKSEYYVAPGSINVKDFGALGDGLHDDTEAIQTALLSAFRRRMPLRVGSVDNYKNGAGDAAVPVVVFPEGVYKISKTLVGYREMCLKGLGNAVIRQSDSSKDIYYQHRMYRATISDLEFEGGKIQLRFWSMNNDATMILIENCRFTNSSSEAVRCRSYSEPQFPGDKTSSPTPASPYEVIEKEDGATELIREKDMESLPHWRNSTLIVIADSIFKNCMRAFNLGTDGMVVENCSITANPDTVGPIMICKDRKIELRKVSCYAPASQNHQYWIEADLFNTTCRNSKFISEKPMCLVNQVREPWYESTCIIVEECEFSSAGCPEGAVLNLQAIPNALYFSGNREITEKKVHAVAWKPPQTTEFLKEHRYFKNIPVDSQFNFCLNRNSTNISTDLPEAAKAFIRPDLPRHFRDQFLVEPDQRLTAPVTVPVGEPVFAVEHGLVGDGVTDDSAALQRAVDAAALRTPSIVVLPGKLIKLQSPVTLPARLTLLGSGCSYLIGDGSNNAFNSVGVKELLVKDLGFKGFKTALELRTEATEEANVIVQRCKFYNCSKYEIDCISDKPGKLNQTRLQVKNCLLNGRTMVHTNANSALLSNLWLHGDWLADDQAYIVNRGGDMFVESVLGVPQCLKGRTMKHLVTGEEKEWEYGGNMRWFDNYGKLIIKDMRFGGESGGPCAVFSLSPESLLFMQGGFTTMNNLYTKRCYSYFVTPPKAAVFMANNNIPGPQDRAIWIKGPNCSEVAAESVFISGPGVGLPLAKDADGAANAYWQKPR